MTSDWGYSGFVPALNGPESPQDREIRVDHSHGYSGGASSHIGVQGAPPMSRRVPEDQTRTTPLSNVYSFTPIPGAEQHKRHRHQYEDIERKYKCGWNGCEKAYGTVNHLNAHVTMQAHGEKRTPEEFRKSVKLDASAIKPAQSIDAPKAQQAEASDVNDARENCGSNSPCNTLSVGNLPTQTSEDELKAVFSKQQGYKRICFRTKQNDPMCLVEFDDVAFAINALNNLDGYLLHNSTKGGLLLSSSKNPLGVPSNQIGRSPGGPGSSKDGTATSSVSAQPEPKAERKAAGPGRSIGEYDRSSHLAYRTAPEPTLEDSLPPGWIAQWDNSSKKYYYVHISTGMSQFDLPTGEASKRNSWDGQSLDLWDKGDAGSDLRNAMVAADEPIDDGVFALLTASTSAGFKSKDIMKHIRKNAMDNLLTRAKMSDKSSSSRPPEATSTTSTAAASKQTRNLGSRRPRQLHDEPHSPVNDTDVEMSEPEDLNRDANRFSRDYQFNIGATDKEIHGKAVALFDFAPENDNELSLIEGQIVMVLHRKGHGWLMAQDLKTGESGLIPEEYIRILRDIEDGRSLYRPASPVPRSVQPHISAQFGSEEYVDGSNDQISGILPQSPGPKGNLYNMTTQKSRSKVQLQSVESDQERSSARLLSPALSSPEVSPIGYATTLQESEEDDESEGESEELSNDGRSQEKPRPAQRVETALFVLERLGSHEEGNSDLEVVRPDHYEDAASDNNSSASKDLFHQRSEELHLQLVEYSSDDEGHERQYGQLKKRWSAGVFKRSYSYSELDSSSSDSDPLYETNPKARRLRLRRRLLGIEESSPTDKNNARSNSGLHSPVAEGRLDGKGSPSIPSDDGFTLDETPVFQDEDVMDVETASPASEEPSLVGEHHLEDLLRQPIQVTQEEVTDSHGNPEGDNYKPLRSETPVETPDIPAAERHKERRSPITTFQYDPVPLENTREGDAVKDLAERRRIQNRIAQRNYRKNLKQRLEALENRIQGREAGRSQGTHPNDPDNGPDEAGIDAEVFAYQDFGEEVIINCVCGVADDRRFIIPCVACGKWQHIACYYDLAGDVEEGHQCVQCIPREVNRGGNSSSKQSAMLDENPFPFPVSMESDTKHEMTGTETSIGPNERFSGVAYTYPSSVSTNVIFGGVPKRASIQDAESSYRMSWAYPTSPPFKQGPDEIDNPTPMSLTSTHAVKEQTSDPETTMRDIEYGSPMASIAMINDNGTFSAQGEDQVAETWDAHPDQASGESDQHGDEYQLIDHVRDAYLFDEFAGSLEADWNVAQMLLPESWRWDVEFQFGCWTATPIESASPQHYPLTIARAPVVLPVDYQWPPIGGVNPPPDPRPSAPINCHAPLAVETIRDLFLTFEGSVGFYILISGLLQIIVPRDFDTAWASSHLPHKYGGLKVCYIEQTLEATMLPSATETTKARPPLISSNSSLSGIFRSSRTSTAGASPTLKLNDFIEARPKANHRKEKYAGRLGLKVTKDSEPYLLMSTHVITEAMLVKSHREAIFGRSRDRFEKLGDDWNKSVEIWAGNEVIGKVDKSFDTDADMYPNGFYHDVTLIKPTSPASIKDVVSPIANLGWLNHESWASLRHNTSAIKILGCTESHRCAKSIKCSRPSEILVVGEGIFLNQTAAAGNSRSLRDHDMSTWKNLVSRALLYRIYPDFDPPNGYSGIALYADGVREDGSEGPGVVGFQSFVQRSGHVQSFNMDGPALERRLQLGRVAFYGAFEVPEELKRHYDIV